MTTTNNIVLVIPCAQGRERLQDFATAFDISADQILIVEGNTFTEACNSGIQQALKQKADYIGICKSTIQLLTPVIQPLLKILSQEQSIGMIAPIEIIREGTQEFLAYRSQWDLSLPNFYTDSIPPDGDPILLEADYCALNFALFPAKIFSEIGLLDTDFCDEYAIIDFCFRLWKHGYRMVSHQQAQILCAELSISDDSKIQKSRELFLKKHIQYGVNYDQNAVSAVSSWDISNNFLNRYFKKYGLCDETRPRLKFSHPGAVDPNYYPYLFTVWETTELPKKWKPFLARYEHIFLPCHWNYQVFESAGCKNISYVPLGFEPDIFHPWGEKFDFQCDKPFLNICHNQYRKALDVTIHAWQAVKNKMPNARLFLFGYNIDHAHYLGKPDAARWYKKLKHYDYEEAKITFLEPSESLTYEEMAMLYRGAHTFVLNSRSEGFGFPIPEAMACETLTIVPNYGATAEFISGRNCLALTGVPSAADYTDREFENVGLWWEPSLEHLKELLLEAYTMSDAEYSEITHQARQHVLTHFTWRQVARKMYEALQAFQAPKNTVIASPITKKRPIEVWCAQQIIALGKIFLKAGSMMNTQGSLAVVRSALRRIFSRFPQ